MKAYEKFLVGIRDCCTCKYADDDVRCLPCCLCEPETEDANCNMSLYEPNEAISAAQYSKG